MFITPSCAAPLAVSSEQSERCTNDLLSEVDEVPKPKKNERSIYDTLPNSENRLWHIANTHKISKSAGKIGLNCENCGIAFETQACWAKRINHHFCSHSCASEFKKIEIKKNCNVCGNEIIVNPTTYFRHVTCSSECKKEDRKRKMNAQHGNT